jgi:nucleoside-diphosphate-sugar epimerase
MTGYRGDVRWDPSRPDGQPRRRVDGERARQLLGFVPRVGLDEGLRRTIDWFEQQRVG